jgi:hypothetical protein
MNKDDRFTSPTGLMRLDELPPLDPDDAEFLEKMRRVSRDPVPLHKQRRKPITKPRSKPITKPHSNRITKPLSLHVSNHISTLVIITF